MKHSKILYLLVFLFLSTTLTLTSCGNKKETPQQTNSDNSTSFNDTIKLNSYYNFVANFLAGNNTNYDSVKFDQAKVDSFQTEMKAKLDTINNERLIPILNWNSKIIKESGANPNNLAFYPFSGGDFLHLHYMYPEADNYVMLSMEDVGSIPDFRTMSPKIIDEYLQDMNKILRDVFKRSYFITENLGKDLKANKHTVNGMLPILMWAMGVTGNEIIDVKSAKINSSGDVELSDFNSKARNKGVQITFRKAKENKVRTLLYYSCNIADEGIKKNPGLNNYLSKLSTFNSYVKSASYLLHYETFNTMRNEILSKSKYHIQDDTGIPFRYFTADKWDIKLYGEYEKPIKDFAQSLFQKDLDLAYRVPDTYKGTLNFSLGYHWGSKKQNQMIFVRK